MLGKRFEQALVFATRRHGDQKRKGSEVPYVSHLLAVCALVLEAGGDEDEAIAALLHDTVEDQKASLAEIRALFGETVAAVVHGCSDTDRHPKPPWRERKVGFLATLASLPASARLVVVADKLHNARCTLAEFEATGDAVWDKFNGGREGTLWYYRSVVQGLADARGPECSAGGGGAARLTRLLEDIVRRLEAAAARR